MKEVNKLKILGIILILIFATISSVFAIKELPNCCPSSVNDDVIWNYVNKHFPDLSDTSKTNRFEDYKYQFEEKINLCQQDIQGYYSLMYQKMLDEYQEYNFGTSFFNNIKPGNEINYFFRDKYQQSINNIKESSDSIFNLVNAYSSINEDKTDVVTNMNSQLSIFEEKDLDNKIISADKTIVSNYDSCFKNSKIYSCYMPCYEEVDKNNNKISGEKTKLYEEGKLEESYALEYEDYDTCLEKCDLEGTNYKEELDKINDCANNKAKEFNWIIPYMKNRFDVLKMCDKVYDNASGEFQGVFGDPIGGVILRETKITPEEKKKKEVEEKKNLDPSRIDLNLNSRDLKEGVYSKIAFTVDFYGKDKEGNEYLTPSFKIPKLNFKYDLPKGSTLKLRYKIDKSGFKDSSSLDGEIWIARSNLDTLKEPLKVEVSIEGEESLKKTINIIPRDKLRILSIKKNSNQNAWDDSWSTFQINVENPDNKLLKYIIISNSKNSKIYLNGVEHNKVATKITKESSINFGWKAPKISEDARIEYAKHFENLITNLAIKGGGELLTNQVDKNFAKDLDSPIFNPENVKSSFNGMMNTISTGNLGKQIISEYKGPKKGEDWSFYLTKNLVNGFANTEGYFGNYLEKSPIGLQYKIVSYSLVPMQEWYSVVDEMINISQASLISQQDTILVTVENYVGDKDTAKYVVTVDGFERVLK